MKILLAEDDNNIATIAKLALEQLGSHQVDRAEDGAMALEMALNNSYDVILLDEMMPKMNGLNVCRQYKMDCPNPSPIIFLSAKSQESDLEEFRKCALGFITKPFDPTQLCSQIQDILQSGGR